MTSTDNSKTFERPGGQTADFDLMSGCDSRPRSRRRRNEQGFQGDA